MVLRGRGGVLTVVYLLLVIGLAQGQQSLRAVDMPATPVEDTARLIGVSQEVEALRMQAGKAAPNMVDHDLTSRWKTLVLHQRIYERVTTVQLQADATTATIANEIAQASEVHGYLADKRDRTVTRANLLSALVGGGLGATSAGLQLSAQQVKAAAATGIAGGAISAGLAIYGIHAQRGASRALDAESNMLAQIFERPELPTSHYPKVIWQFLSEIAASDPDHLIRRERLLRTWLQVRRLDSPTTAAGRLKVQQVTSKPDQHLALTIDDLEDRIAMLQDVSAKLSYLKRDLAALLESLPPLSPE